MRVAVMYSGGKDSSFTLYDCIKKGFDVRYLVTLVPINPYSYMFHHPNIHLTELHAKSMGIKIIAKETKGEKEAELKDLRNALAGIRDEIDAVVVGGLSSRYQADRFGKVCKELGLRLVAPIWGLEPGKFWRMLLKSGFEVIFSSVSTEGLGKSWLGKKVTKKVLEELEEKGKKYGFDISGEGGDFETLVLDSPVFRKKLIILEARKVWRLDSGVYRITDAVLCDKKRLNELKTEYRKRRKEIKKRLDNFRKLWLESDRAVFAELCFCLCTPQSKATACNRAINRLVLNRVLFEGTAKEIESGLKGVRFRKNKAKWIVMARNLFASKNRFELKKSIREDDILKTREWLVKNIKGMGYKEASHFLRNIGFGRDVAILDRHIMKNLKALGIIKDITKSLTPKRYMEIEKKMKSFSGQIGIPLDELDLLFWAAETGHVFK